MFDDLVQHPQWLHAAAVHLPIAMALLGVPLVYITAVVSKERGTVLRGLALVNYVLLILFAFGAEWSGKKAYDQIPNTLPAETSAGMWDLVEQHEEMAEWVWVLGAVTAVLLALSALRLKWFRGVVMGLAMLASLATAGWVGLTGHYGGLLVYDYGIGTPGKARNRPDDRLAPASVTASAPDEAVPLPVPSLPPAVPSEASPSQPAPVPGVTVPPVPDTPLAAAPAIPPAGAATPPAADGFVPATRHIVPEEAAKVSFVRDVQPILQEHCIDCHEDDSAKGDFRVTSVADLMKPGRKSGPGVIPFQPDESSIIKYIRGILQPQMPRRREPLTEDELHVLRMWIDAGAVDDSAAAAPVSEPVAAPIEPSPETETAPPPAPAPVEPAPPGTAPMPEFSGPASTSPQVQQTGTAVFLGRLSVAAGAGWAAR